MTQKEKKIKPKGRYDFSFPCFLSLISSVEVRFSFLTLRCLGIYRIYTLKRKLPRNVTSVVRRLLMDLTFVAVHIVHKWLLIVFTSGP